MTTTLKNFAKSKDKFEVNLYITEMTVAITATGGSIIRILSLKMKPFQI